MCIWYYEKILVKQFRKHKVIGKIQQKTSESFLNKSLQVYNVPGAGMEHSTYKFFSYKNISLNATAVCEELYIYTKNKINFKFIIR